MFLFFSNPRGCLSSLLISFALSLLLFCSCIIRGQGAGLDSARQTGKPSVGFPLSAQRRVCACHMR